MEDLEIFSKSLMFSAVHDILAAAASIRAGTGRGRSGAGAAWLPFIEEYAVANFANG